MGFATSFGTGFFSGLADTLDKQQASRTKMAEYKKQLELKHPKDVALAEIRANATRAVARDKAKAKIEAARVAVFHDPNIFMDESDITDQKSMQQSSEGAKRMMYYNKNIHKYKGKENLIFDTQIKPFLTETVKLGDNVVGKDFILHKYGNLIKNTTIKDRYVGWLINEGLRIPKQRLDTMGVDKNYQKIKWVVKKPDGGVSIREQLIWKDSSALTHKLVELIKSDGKIEAGIQFAGINKQAFNDQTYWDGTVKMGRQLPETAPGIKAKSGQSAIAAQQGSRDAKVLGHLITEGLKDPEKIIVPGILGTLYEGARNLFTAIREIKDAGGIIQKTEAYYNSSRFGQAYDSKTGKNVQFGTWMKEEGLLNTLLSDNTHALYQFYAVNITYSQAKIKDSSGKIDVNDYRNMHNALFNNLEAAPEIMHRISKDLDVAHAYHGIIEQGVDPAVAGTVARSIYPDMSGTTPALGTRQFLPPLSVGGETVFRRRRTVSGGN